MLMGSALLRARASGRLRTHTQLTALPALTRTASTQPQPRVGARHNLPHAPLRHAQARSHPPPPPGPAAEWAPPPRAAAAWAAAAAAATEGAGAAAVPAPARAAAAAPRAHRRLPDPPHHHRPPATAAAAAAPGRPVSVPLVGCYQLDRITLGAYQERTRARRTCDAIGN